MSLLTHCGGRVVDVQELESIELPQTTRTYQPLPYTDFIDMVKEAGSKRLAGYELTNESYAVSKNNKKMFGVLTYKYSYRDLKEKLFSIKDRPDEDFQLSIGIRSSLDKSIRPEICGGAKVFVCDNLLFTGDIMAFRKQTKFIYRDIMDEIEKMLGRCILNFITLKRQKDFLKSNKITQDNGYRQLGYLAGLGVLSPTQFTSAMQEWKDPVYSEFIERNQWSFYNACTEALKSTNPRKIMERHIQLHNVMQPAMA